MKNLKEQKLQNILSKLTPEQCVKIATIVEPAVKWKIAISDFKWDGFDLVNKNSDKKESHIFQIDYRNFVLNLSEIKKRFRLYFDMSEVQISSDKLFEIYEYLIGISKNNVKHWNDAVDNPPEETGRYWCNVREYNDLGVSNFQWNCSYNKGKNFWNVDSLDNTCCNVTHWTTLMELPEIKNHLYCPSCFEEVSDEDVSCENCGNDLDGTKWFNIAISKENAEGIKKIIKK